MTAEQQTTSAAVPRYADGTAIPHELTLPPPEFPTDAPFIDRVNPLIRFVCAVLCTAPLFLTVDWVSAVTAFVCAITALMLAGLPLRRIALRTIPILLAAPLSGLSMLFYAKPGGAIYWEFGIIVISERSIDLALAISLRVLAIGVPSMALLAGIEPTRFGDSCAQIARVPARFVLGIVAGFRLGAVFVDDWTALHQARRARGLGEGRRVWRFFTMAFALLVLALRRGASLSIAMEARGLRSGPRTWARPVTLHARDAVAIVVSLVIPAVAIGLSILMGTFHLVGSGTGAS